MDRTNENMEGLVADLSQTMAKVIENLRLRKDKTLHGLPTGFAELDEMLSGLNNGNLIVVAGHPGIGKTSFALQISEQLAVDKDIAVAYFSMRLSVEQLIERMLLGRRHISLRSARRGELIKSDWDRIEKTASEISKKPIYVDETSRLTLTELRYKAELLKRQKDIRCIIVDCLQAMRSESNIDLVANDFAEISRSLKLMALELNVPVLLLVQLGFDLIRQEEERAEPRLADLGEAIIVERYADVLMLINRESYYGFCPPDSTHTEIMITKNRNGSTGMIGLNFNEDIARFENLTKA